MLDVAGWLELGEWTTPDDDLMRERGDMPIETSASGQLSQRWKKIRKKGKKLAAARSVSISAQRDAGLPG